jgi:hypothetical protein
VWSCSSSTKNSESNLRRPAKNSKKDSKEYPEWRRRATLNRHVDLRLSDRVLRVRMQANDQALANEDFVLDVDGRRMAAARTAADGLIEQRLPVGAKLVEIRIPRLQLHRSIEVAPAEKFPSVSTLLGVQTRLAQLGFLPQEPNGKADQLTRDALARFRRAKDWATTAYSTTRRARRWCGRMGASR